MSKTELDFEFAPLRSLSDFLLESARFQIPNIRDLEKWGKRVTSNLLYYQTNYFFMSIVVFVIVGILHPTKMACGFLVTAVMFTLSCYVTSEKVSASRFKKNHPIIFVILVLLAVYTVAHMLDSLLIFSLGILLPFSAIFVHASLRLRNMKNKLANKVEVLGLRKTPMGLFLEEFGLEQEIF